MDPDATLKEMRELAIMLADSRDIDGEQCVHLAELFLALDRWIMNGGFMPRSWRVHGNAVR